MKELPKFNSIEEVKEFISSTDSIGTISFVDKEGKVITKRVDDFIEEVGLEEAAEFIYNNMTEAQGLSVTSEELNDIIERYKKDRNSLTDKEKLILIMSMEGTQGMSNDLSRMNDIMTFFLKCIVEYGGELTESYAGLLSILLTIMEFTFALSSDLAPHVDNSSTYKEIVNNVAEQIIIPDDIDEASLLLGLIHIIGKRFVSSSTVQMPVNYHAFAERFCLDTDFIFGDLDDLDYEDEEDDESINDKPEESGKVVNIDVRKALKEDKL